jgi:antitoxin component YwqK of YwqJK toxin-antitoxin module
LGKQAMNWEAIKHIYRNILIYGSKIKYLEKNKYILTYFSSDKKFEQREFDNGERHGKSFGWFSNGFKRWEIEHQHSKLHGIYRIWNEDGIMLLNHKYKNGKPVKE